MMAFGVLVVPSPGFLIVVAMIYSQLNALMISYSQMI